MKKIAFIILTVFLYSCSSTQLVRDPKSNKKVKIYQNEDFSFYYPRNWRVQDNTLQIFNFLVILKPVNGNVKSKTNLSFEQGKTVESKTHSYNKSIVNSLTISKIMKCKNIEELLKQKTKDNSIAKYTNTISKRNDNYFIQYRTIRKSKNSKIKMIPMNITNHYIKKDGIVYILSFSFEAGKEKIFANSTQLILDSFKFNDGTSLE